MGEKKSLKSIRFERGLTQLQLMLDSGVMMSRISQIENQKFIPGDDDRKKIAQALKLGVSDIDWPELESAQAANGE